MDNYAYDELPNESKTLHKLKRLFQKLGIRLHKAMNPVDRTQLSDAESEAYAVFRRMVKEGENDLLTSPLSGKYYIKSDSQEMLVILGNGQVSIVNHVFGYNVPLSQKAEGKMKDMFLDEVEKRREAMEQEFTANVRHSLKTIINRLDHEK
jgi:hypothetical protein